MSNGAVFGSAAALRSPGHPPQLKEVGKAKDKLNYLNKGYGMGNWQDIYEILIPQGRPVQSFCHALVGEGEAHFLLTGLSLAGYQGAAIPKEAGPVAT